MHKVFTYFDFPNFEQLDPATLLDKSESELNALGQELSIDFHNLWCYRSENFCNNPLYDKEYQLARLPLERNAAMLAAALEPFYKAMLVEPVPA